MTSGGLTKSELRAHLKDHRAELAARNPDAGETLAEKFPMKLLERYGPVVAGYLPIRDEIDPRPLMRRLADAGAELCLPRVNDDGERMTYRAWGFDEPLEERPFGLQEPLASAEVVQPTLILVPLLAFDGHGNRLGYGKGHYDRALASLREHGRAFACAVAFHGQMIDEVPAEPHDQLLDWAITEQGSVPLFMMRNMKQLAGSDDDGPAVA